MRLLALIPLALGLALSLPARAEILDIAVGDKSFQGRFSGPLPRVRDTGAQYELGLLSRPDDKPVDLLQVHAGFLLTGDAGARDVRLKVETLQPIGSFKVRGALNWARQLAPEEAILSGTRGQ